jgi:hypothetical protein
MEHGQISLGVYVGAQEITWLSATNYVTEIRRTPPIVIKENVINRLIVSLLYCLDQIYNNAYRNDIYCNQRYSFCYHFSALSWFWRMCSAYKLWSSSLYSFLQPPVTSSLFGPNILLNILFSNALSLCSSIFRAGKWRWRVSPKRRFYFQRTALHHIPETRNCLHHHCENLESYKLNTVPLKLIIIIRSTDNGRTQRQSEREIRF